MWLIYDDDYHLRENKGIFLLYANYLLSLLNSNNLI